MLVLSRKPSERIRIGESIVVTVVRIDSNTVRLGIEAPDEVRVLRAELLPETTIERGSMPALRRRHAEFAENSV